MRQLLNATFPSLTSPCCPPARAYVFLTTSLSPAPCWSPCCLPWLLCCLPAEGPALASETPMRQCRRHHYPTPGYMLSWFWEGQVGGTFSQSQVQRALNSPPARLPPAASFPSSQRALLSLLECGGISLLHALPQSHSPPMPQPVPLGIPEFPGSLYMPIPIHARDSRLTWAPGTPTTRTEGPALLTPHILTRHSAHPGSFQGA